jgi:apolipoprotein D and lipocalin family protein
MITGRRLGLIALICMLSACSSRPSLPTARSVDLQRFMGDWYVIASIPTSMERGAHNAVESYRLDQDGSIATTFTYRDGSFDGPEKVMRPRGYVRDTASNAVWGMQFIWPIRAEYLIAHVDADYRETIIARSRRDYVWIMARSPTLSDNDYARLARMVADLGYDSSKLLKVPQRW